MKKSFHKYIAFLLLLVATSYSLDLHGFSHVFDDDKFEDDKHCEICIINHQKNQDLISLEPNSNDFDLQLNQDIPTTFVTVFSEQNVFKNLFLEGQFFNKPPPLYI